MGKKDSSLLLGVGAGIFLLLVFFSINPNRLGSETKSQNSFNIIEKPILLSLANKFKETERPPVKFFHDKHTNSLTCEACHPTDDRGNLNYIFPKIKDEKNKKSLMNAYHESCIGCHQKFIQEGKESGPIVCGKCHLVANVNFKGEPWPDAGFDYYTHSVHANLSGDCMSCHHTGDRVSCRQCHGLTDNGIPSYRKVAHYSCLKCHLQSQAGPVSCNRCHSGIKRDLAELAKVPRPDIGQPKITHISLSDAKMPAVYFNHKNHEGYTSSCRICHHKAMGNCNNCHTQQGSAAGGYISLANSSHKSSSERSCVGCHETVKTNQQCIGCHQTRKNGLTETSCFACHRSPDDKTTCPAINSNSLYSLIQTLPEKMVIRKLENKYSEVNFPHSHHICTLANISQNNKLADYFHCNPMTICLGCHHQTALSPGKPVPSCSTCHSLTQTTYLKENSLHLEKAYHRQCLGCHTSMKAGPTNCNNGCHIPQKSEVAKGAQ